MNERFSSLEALAAEVIATFEIKTPPVPIEHMLQHPRTGMWEEVDIRQLSSGFLSLEDRYSPRMSLARLLARQIAFSSWGKKRGILPLLDAPDAVAAFARMLIMPASMVEALSDNARTATNMRQHFEVPEKDARSRLDDLATYR